MKTRKPLNKKIGDISIIKDGPYISLIGPFGGICIDPNGYALYHIAYQLLKWACWFDKKTDKNKK